MKPATETSDEASQPASGASAREVDVAVIGAGQAGLTSGYFLLRAGFQQPDGLVMLDGNTGPGGAWQHRWPTLRFGSAHRLYPLPDFPLGWVDEDRRAADVVSGYYGRFERKFGLDVHRPVQVRAVRSGADQRLLLETSAGTWSARALVNASGTWTKPFWPSYPGASTFKGRQLHTADYRRPQEFAGRHVIVVGGGNSAVQLLAEISNWTTTTWVTRREPVCGKVRSTSQRAGRPWPWWRKRSGLANHRPAWSA